MIFTVKEATERLGISPQRVRLLLAEGRIKGKKLGHDWAVLDLKYTRMKRGRKPRVVKREYSEFDKLLDEFLQGKRSPSNEVK